MNRRSIERLRRKFISLSTLTYFLVLLFMGGTINVTYYISTMRQIRSVLSYLAENGGELPSRSTSGLSDSASEDPEDAAADSAPEDVEADFEDFSAEFRYSTRYFSFLFSDDYEILAAHLGRVAAISDETAERMAVRAARSGRSFGNSGNYYYRVTDTDDGTLVVFLNCASQIGSLERIFRVTVFIGIAGLIITFCLVYIFSYRVIQPEIENIRRQKQFITNASHELKTPLAVIRANTEIEEMIHGETDWTQSTMRQVDRLSGLVENLVMISRAQEREDKSHMAEINVSRAVEESVRPYGSLAQQDGKEFEIAVPENIMLVSDESKIRQLTTLLIDNAFKYCDEHGKVRVQLDTLKKGKQVRLTISNSFAEGANVDYSRFFERFYREDESHNVDKGGYGIGLSIAESICQQTGGSISVGWKDGVISFTCILV